MVLSLRESTRAARRRAAHAIREAAAALVAASVVLAVAAVPVASASDGGGQSGPTRPAYIFVDPGTFGGPLNFLNWPGIPVTDTGVLVGSADTTIADTDYPEFSSNPVLAQAFAWRDGRLMNLGCTARQQQQRHLRHEQPRRGSGAFGERADRPEH